MKGQIKFIRILILTCVIFLIIAVLLPDFSVLGLKYTSVHISEIFSVSKQQQNPNADSLTEKYLNVENNNQTDNILNFKMDKSYAQEAIFNKLTDSVFAGIFPDTNNYFINILRQTILAEIKSKNSSSPYFVNPKIKGKRALDSFFKSLTNSTDSSVVHIAHYGDSQLEGDRITCVLRKLFQQKFGGSGAGFVPITDICDHVSLTRKASANWNRENVFHNHSKDVFYGLSGMMFSYEPKSQKSLVSESSEKQFSIAKSNFQTMASVKLKFTNKYSHAYIMYGKNKEPFFVRTSNSDKEILGIDTLKPSSGFTIQELKTKSSPSDLGIEFSSNFKPEIYGLLFDGEKGVQIDNYAIRGHAGTGLMNIDVPFLKDQIKKTNTHLLIFQYGNNTIPYIKSEKECRRLEETYYKLFMQFKTMNPEISILVIGVGDMATKSKGECASYPMIPKVREAQRNAAIRAHCAFWDLYEFMGGTNSILTWTNKKLASKDGHLSSRGQELVGKELYNKIYSEYNNYTYSHHNK